MYFTVLVKIKYEGEQPNEEKWYANCFLKKGRLYRIVKYYKFDGNRYVQKERTEPVERDDREILRHIQQEGYYY